MTPTEIVALIGASSTTTVAVGGYVFNWFSGARAQTAARELAQQAHQHERALTRAQLLHAELRAAYEEVAHFVGWLAAYVERTHPLIGPVPPVPEPPTDEEALAMSARITIIASDDVMSALDAVMQTYQRFRFAAEAVDDPQHDRAARDELDQARQAFRDAKLELERAFRREVRA
jgi:hypothetical protein